MIAYKLRLYLAMEPWPKETAQVSVITGRGIRIFTLIRSKKDPLLLKESLICRPFRADASWTRLKLGSLSDLPRSGYRTQPRVSNPGFTSPVTIHPEGV